MLLLNSTSLDVSTVGLRIQLTLGTALEQTGGHTGDQTLVVPRPSSSLHGICRNSIRFGAVEYPKGVRPSAQQHAASWGVEQLRATNKELPRATNKELPFHTVLCRADSGVPKAAAVRGRLDVEQLPTACEEPRIRICGGMRRSCACKGACRADLLG